MAKWVCTVCGYVYEGETAPAECPVCHVGTDKFKKVEGDLVLAAEHEYGVYGKTVKNNPDISDEDKKYIFDQLDETEVEMEFAACGILADYYYRTCEIEDAKDIREQQSVQKEVGRIFSDLAFVKENPDKEKLWHRIENYKSITLLS